METNPLNENLMHLGEMIRRRAEETLARHGNERVWSRHEFMGILQEEFDELWDTVKGDEDDVHVLDEVLDVLFVCFWYAYRQREDGTTLADECDRMNAMRAKRRFHE